MQGVFKTVGTIGAAELFGRTKGAVVNNIIDEAAERARITAELLEMIEKALAKENIE